MNGCRNQWDAKKWTDQNGEMKRSDWNRKMKTWSEDGGVVTALGSRNRGWESDGSVESRT